MKEQIEYNVFEWLCNVNGKATMVGEMNIYELQQALCRTMHIIQELEDHIDASHRIIKEYHKY